MKLEYKSPLPYSTPPRYWWAIIVFYYLRDCAVICGE